MLVVCPLLEDVNLALIVCEFKQLALIGVVASPLHGHEGPRDLRRYVISSVGFAFHTAAWRNVPLAVHDFTACCAVKCKLISYTQA